MFLEEGGGFVVWDGLFGFWLRDQRDSFLVGGVMFGFRG